MPSVIDHLLVLVLVVVFPLYAMWFGWPSTLRAVATGKAGARVREYWWMIAMQWVLVGVLVAVWLAAHRPLGRGLVDPNRRRRPRHLRLAPDKTLWVGRIGRRQYLPTRLPY